MSIRLENLKKALCSCDISPHCLLNRELLSRKGNKVGRVDLTAMGAFPYFPSGCVRYAQPFSVWICFLARTFCVSQSETCIPKEVGIAPGCEQYPCVMQVRAVDAHCVCKMDWPGGSTPESDFL